MPQRFLRPGIRTSDRWNSVKSPHAHTLYIAILTLVDDFGRYDGRDHILWADAFTAWNFHHPEDSVNLQEVAAICSNLHEVGLVEFYEIEGKKYLQVTQWQERVRDGVKEKYPKNEKLLQNPAKSCKILPPSSPSSPSPVPSPSPSPVAEKVVCVPAAPVVEPWGEKPLPIIEATEHLRTQIGAMYGRNWERWGNDEEQALCVVSRRKNVKVELLKIIGLREDKIRDGKGSSFPHSIIALLDGWQKTLDATFSYQTTKPKSVLEKEIDKLTR
jgi:hypothetical protein